MSNLLAGSRQRRVEKTADEAIDAHLESRLSMLKPRPVVSLSAKEKLRSLLKRAASDKTPIRSVVKANMKRLGPGRAEAVAVAINGEIKGKKNWSLHPSAKLSDDDLAIDGDVLLALDAISSIDLSEVFLQARAMDDGQTREAALLLGVSGQNELRSWGDGLVLEEKS